MSSILTLAGNNTSTGFYPHSIDQSLRGNEADSPYLSRTPSSASNRKTYTISAWIKPSLEVATFSILGAGSSGSAYYIFGIEGDDLYFEETSSGGSLRANRKLRDPSAWYHLVASIDTTQATASNRIKLYVNGVRETSFSGETYMAQDFQSAYINNTSVHYIGHSPVQGSHYLNGYIGEVNFIDGTALGPDSFGETKDGIWVAKNVSGLTFGTNGFHLDFADSGAIGNDVSGQNNDFAVSGLAATDVVLTSPTNTFATLNPLNNPDGAFSEGNLKWTSTTTDQRIALSTMPVDSLGTDDSYAEVRIGSKSSTYWAIGVFGNPKSWNPRVMYRSDGVINRDNTVTQTGVGTFSEGDIMSITYDVSSGTVTFYKNNSSVTTETVGDTDNVQYFGCTSDSSGSSANYNWNFGQDSSFAGNETAQGNADANGQGDFYYTPPSGLALCSANLPEPAIIDGSEYFNTVLYNGTGSSQAVTGVGFAPSLTWLKRRNNASTHKLMDVVRGDGLTLASNNVNQEQNEPSVFASLDADGFTVAGATNSTNQTGGTYVAWNWLAGTSVSGNTTGSGTAKAYSGSVSAESGFSIITYKGNGTAGHTIPHNLGAKPSMVIFKNRDVDDQWAVYHKDILATHNLSLNLSDGKADQDNRFNDTEPTSSVMTLGTGHVVNANDEDYIAYFFTDIDQYCKAGVYTGNGNADGSYVALNFRPAWVMIKRADDASHWAMIDTARSPYNVSTAWLAANLTASEAGLSTNSYDILSNGFKARDTLYNVSGGTYIYLAISEQAGKFSNAK